MRGVRAAALCFRCAFRLDFAKVLFGLVLREALGPLRAALRRRTFRERVRSDLVPKKSSRLIMFFLVFSGLLTLQNHFPF